MLTKKRSRYKPFYRQFLKLRENLQNRKKLLKFKKKKWEILVQNYKKQLKRYKKFKPRNMNKYIVSKYSNRFHSYKKRFKTTLFEIQKFNLFYGGLSRKFLKKQLILLKKNRKLNLAFLELFEKRLDTVLYKAKFSFSIKNARQLIVHGKVFVNQKPIKVKSYVLKPGDLISINPKYVSIIKKNLDQSQIWPIPPKHLTINYKTMQIIFGNLKETNFAISYNFNLEKIIINHHYIK